MPVTVIRSEKMKRCGFCSTEHHVNCCIAVEGQVNEQFPDGRVWLCQCEEKACADRARIKCFDCGNRVEAEIDPDTWRCIDIEACQAEIQAKREANPLYAQLREIEEKVTMAETKTKTAKKAAAAPKVGKCLCCGSATKGGDFLPGHDARFVSQRVAAVLDGNEAKADARKACGDVSANLGAKFGKSLNLATERKAAKAKAAKDKAAAKKAPAKKAATK